MPRPELCAECKLFPGCREDANPLCACACHIRRTGWDAGRAEGEREGRAEAARLVRDRFESYAREMPPAHRTEYAHGYASGLERITACLESLAASPSPVAPARQRGDCCSFHRTGGLPTISCLIAAAAPAQPVAPPPDETARRLLAELVAALCDQESATEALVQAVLAGAEKAPPVPRFSQTRMRVLELRDRARAYLAGAPAARIGADPEPVKR